MRKNPKFWIAFGIIMIFLAGVVAGVLLEDHVLDKKQRRPGRKRTSPSFLSMDEMSQELSLSEEQRTKIAEIFDINNKERLKILSSQFRKQLSVIRSQLIEEIKNVLDDEQKKKFDAMLQRYAEKRKKDQASRRNHSKRPEEKKEARQ